MTAEENLLFFAEMYGLEDPKTRVRELLVSVELDHRRLDVVSTFLAWHVAAPFDRPGAASPPRRALLDEPYSGLDPHAMDILDNLIAQIRGDHTFVMSATTSTRAWNSVRTRSSWRAGRSSCSKTATRSMSRSSARRTALRGTGVA